jgi:hypothetical protein
MLFSILGWLYKQLWSRTTGRPWTYVIRQYTKHQQWARAGAVILYSGLLVPPVLHNLWVDALVLLTLYFLCFLAGHLWWDTAGKYIKR